MVAACTSTQTDATGASVASVSVTPTTTTLSVGSQIPLQAVVQDASGKSITGTNIFWSVRDPSIATVSAAGVVTGLALGSTEVAASSNGKSGIASITVQKTPVASVAVSPPHVDAAPGGHAQFSAVAYDAAQNPLSGRVIAWSTSNSAVAVVDTNGFMTAVGQGSATITATSEGKSGTATVTVSQVPVATVTVTPTPISMSLGQTTQLSATLTDASGNVLSGRVVAWSSSSPGVATVSSSGLVTAVAAGSTTITATSEGKSGTAAVTISTVAVGSVTVQPQSPLILLGTSIQLSATVRDVNGVVVTNRVVTWSTSNAAVATVTSAGVVTGVGGGTATITATSEGKSGTTSVTVTP
jgi:trimeric autotransporter adhesin